MDSVAVKIKDFRGRLGEAYLNGKSGFELSNSITDFYDGTIGSLFKSVLSPLRVATALIALGGYGRREMAPYSDVDLLLLFENENESGRCMDIINGITYPLWDAGVEIQGVARTLKDCKKAASEDVRSLSSMLEARFLDGSEYLFDKLKKWTDEVFKNRIKRSAFLKNKISEYRNRLAKYGDSVFVGEPHVKEGEGGLRSYHSALWVAGAKYGAPTLERLFSAGKIDKANLDEWKRSVDFILRVRSGLHLISRRRNDRLDYENQNILSKQMVMTAEEFMREFYMNASFIHHGAERLIGMAETKPLAARIKNALLPGKLTGNVYLKNGKISIPADVVMKSPETVFLAWNKEHNLKVSMSDETKHEIHNACKSWPSGIKNNAGVIWQVKEMIKDPIGLHNIFGEMHETGALFRLFPEFEAIHYLVQCDAFHIYTVDIHTIFLLREISRLASGEYAREYPVFADEYNQIERADLLVLAALFHDVGKRRQTGISHDEMGSEEVENVMRRMGYPQKDIETVAFLVRSHRTLTKLAFYRDIDDLQMVENLAVTIKTVDNLRFLFILTFADVRSTHPDIWNGWKRDLLTTLYQRTKDMLETGSYTNRRLEDELKKKEERIAALVKMLESEPVILEADESSGSDYNEVTVVTRDAPGLFSKIAAVFSASGLNILEAYLNTSENGVVVDTFKVTNLSGKKMRHDYNWKKLSSILKEAVFGSVNLNELIALHTTHGKRATRLKKSRMATSNEIIVDNDVSPYYTVVEIHAPDRVGLLYDLARRLFESGCNIYLARATTHIDRVTDVFYIRKIDGRKISEKNELDSLKKDLFQCMGV